MRRALRRRAAVDYRVLPILATDAARWVTALPFTSTVVRNCEEMRVSADLAMRSFGHWAMILVASPGLLATHGEPQALTGIERMPTPSMATVGQEHPWRLVDESISQQLFDRYRQIANPFSRRVKDGVDDRGRHGDGRQLPEPLCSEGTCL